MHGLISATRRRRQRSRPVATSVTAGVPPPSGPSPPPGSISTRRSRPWSGRPRTAAVTSTTCGPRSPCSKPDLCKSKLSSWPGTCRCSRPRIKRACGARFTVDDAGAWHDLAQCGQLRNSGSTFGRGAGIGGILSDCRDFGRSSPRDGEQRACPCHERAITTIFAREFLADALTAVPGRGEYSTCRRLLGGVWHQMLTEGGSDYFDRVKRANAARFISNTEWQPWHFDRIALLLPVQAGSW